MIQIAHPQPFVMIRLLVQIEDDFRKKFEEQRLGKTLVRRDRRLDELNRLVESAMASFDSGMFDSDIEHLNVIAKLCRIQSHHENAANTQLFEIHPPFERVETSCHSCS